MKKAIIAGVLILILSEPIITSANTTNYRFTSQEHDPASDLYYYDQRYYQSDVGRFTQPDPLGNYLVTPELKQKTNKELEEILANPQQLNSYSYTSGNPINQIDPTGEFNWETGEVESGDSLSKVFGDRWQEVAEYNNLKNPNLIYPGQILKIPWQEGSFIDKTVDVGSSIIPGLSDIRDFAELVYGKDLVTGEKMSYLNRAEMVGVALLPIVSGPIVRKVEKWGQRLSKTVNQKIVNNKYVKKIFKSVGLKPKKVMDSLNLPQKIESQVDSFGQNLGDYVKTFIKGIFRR